MIPLLEFIIESFPVLNIFFFFNFPLERNIDF